MTRRVASSIGALIAVVAVGALFYLIRPAESQSEPNAKPFEVEPSFVLIDATESNNREATIRIKNVSTRRARLLSVTSSCGCTLVEPPEDKILEPGHSTTIRV